MKNYYRHGNTVFMLDMDSDVVISVTHSDFSKAIAITKDAPQAATIMNHSFSSSLNQSQRGDYPIILSDENEFNEQKALIKDYLVSHSINI
jgi:hypothetical protein